MFFKGSRYAKVETAEITLKGRTVRYKKVRFIVQPRRLRAHTVMQHDRLDNLSYRYLRDSERFWRICDLNYALWPDDLLAASGRQIDIPDPTED